MNTTESSFIELREMSQVLKGRGMRSVLAVEEEIAKLREQLVELQFNYKVRDEAHDYWKQRAEAADAECLEQARLNGMGGERELALMAKLEAAESKLKAAELEESLFYFEIDEGFFDLGSLFSEDELRTKLGRISKGRHYLFTRAIRMREGPVEGAYPTPPADVQELIAKAREEGRKEAAVKLRHVCNLWIDPETAEIIVDRCDHEPSECTPAYITEWVKQQ